MLVIVLDVDDEKHSIEYNRMEYPSLMELISNTYYSEIGACKGKGLCGTCIIEVVDGFHEQPINDQEIETLRKNGVYDKKHRLACQIILNEEVNGAEFKEFVE